MSLLSDRWISTFLEAMAAEHGAARNTLLSYGRDLTDFAAWIEARKGDLEAAARADVESYLIFCEAQGLSKATRARRLSSIRQMFRFAHEEGWRTDHPAQRIHGPGASRTSEPGITGTPSRVSCRRTQVLRLRVSVSTAAGFMIRMLG